MRMSAAGVVGSPQPPAYLQLMTPFRSWPNLGCSSLPLAPGKFFLNPTCTPCAYVDPVFLYKTLSRGHDPYTYGRVRQHVLER